MTHDEFWDEVKKLPTEALGMEGNIVIDHDNKMYQVYDVDPYTGYFDFILNEEENCIEAMKFDYDMGCVLEGEIHTLFEYEGNNIEEWKDVGERAFHDHQEVWGRFKIFVAKYREFVDNTKDYLNNNERD